MFALKTRALVQNQPWSRQGWCWVVIPTFTPWAPQAAAPPKSIAQQSLAASLLPCTAFFAHATPFGQYCWSSSLLLLPFSARMCCDVPQEPPGMELGETRVISAKSNEARGPFTLNILIEMVFPSFSLPLCPPTRSGSVKGTQLMALLARCCTLYIPDELHTSL